MRPPVKIWKEEKQPPLYRLIRRIAWRLTPKYKLYGVEKLPEDPCVIVGNHCQVYGPFAAEFYMPRSHYIWCNGEMMDRKEVPAYAFQDFWSMKPRRWHWFYRLLSHIIAPLSEYIFTRAHTIPVYHDVRIITTFRKSVERLETEADVVIFPEKNEPFNQIICQFQEHFADLARLYYQQKGKVLCFVPMYIAPRLKSIHFGKPIRYVPEAPADEERKRICDAMKKAVTDLATALPRHVVVPYPNIPKKQYPLNTDRVTDR